MRHLGVLGGTFDPIHQGHLALAHAAMGVFGLSGVLLCPAANPPHKEQATATARQRLKMCRLAAQGQDDILVSDADLQDKPGYTVALMKRLHKEYPNTRFSFIIGADKLASLPRWYKAEELFTLCDFICCPRKGAEDAEALRAAQAAGAKVHMLPVVHFPGASTHIREALSRLEDAPQVPLPVLSYIARHGLYCQDVLPTLKGMMNEHRFRHTLGVRDTAVELAVRYGAPVMKSAMAALLHDCAKGMPAKEMRRIAREHGLAADETMLSSGALLHGPVGAVVARDQFGIRDEDVLSAIRCHTMGRENMTVLDLVIFVADAIEPGREEYPGLHAQRELVKSSLRCAALRSLQGTRDYLAAQGKLFYGQSMATMRDLEAQLTSEEKMLMNRY